MIRDVDMNMEYGRRIYKAGAPIYANMQNGMAQALIDQSGIKVDICLNRAKTPKTPFLPIMAKYAKAPFRAINAYFAALEAELLDCVALVASGQGMRNAGQSQECKEQARSLGAGGNTGFGRPAPPILSPFACESLAGPLLGPGRVRTPHLAQEAPTAGLRPDISLARAMPADGAMISSGAHHRIRGHNAWNADQEAELLEYGVHFHDNPAQKGPTLEYGTGIYAPGVRTVIEGSTGAQNTTPGCASGGLRKKNGE